jgi:hypothetical protein
MLKKLMMGAGFVALIATSAMAQSYQPEWGSGNIVPNTSPAPSISAMRDSAPDAYAYQPAPRQRHMNHHMDRDTHIQNRD